MEEKQVLQDAVATITNEPVILRVEIHPRTAKDRFLMKIGLMKKEVVFHIQSPVLGTRWRIGARTKNITDDLFKSDTISTAKTRGTDAIDDLVYIIASGIENRKRQPSKSLQEFIKWNFTEADMITALQAIFSKIDIEAFMKSIILLKGTDIMKKMSPEDQEELIAPGD